MRRIEALRQQLAAAGINPTYLQRLAGELNDHFADLAREARGRRRTSTEVLAEAWTRLGSADDIATAFLERPELRSWKFRHPRVSECVDLIERYAVALGSPARAIRPTLPALTRYGIATATSLVLGFAVLLAAQGLTSSEAGRPGLPDTVARRYVTVHPLMLDDRASSSLSLDPISVARPTSAGARPSSPLLANAGPAPGLVAQPMIETLTAVEYRDYLPILKVAPIYPASALSMRIEGYVVLEFTISRTGAVKNVVVVESSNPLFEQSATEAAYKFKYYPRIVDGQPVEVEGVRNRLTFDLRA